MVFKQGTLPVPGKRFWLLLFVLFFTPSLIYTFATTENESVRTPSSPLSPGPQKPQSTTARGWTFQDPPSSVGFSWDRRKQSESTHDIADFVEFAAARFPTELPPARFPSEGTAFQAVDSFNTERCRVLPQGWTERAVTYDDAQKNKDLSAAWLHDRTAYRSLLQPASALSR